MSPSKRNSPDPALAPSPIGTIACLAPGSDEPRACLAVAAAGRLRIHQNAKSPESGSVGFNRLTGHSHCSLPVYCFPHHASHHLLPLAGTSFLLGEAFPAEPFPRQHVPDRSADVPHLRLVAIKLSFALSRRFNLGWATLTDALLGASCLCLAMHFAYCLCL